MYVIQTLILQVRIGFFVVQDGYRSLTISSSIWLHVEVISDFEPNFKLETSIPEKVVWTAPEFHANFGGSIIYFRFLFTVY